MAHEERNQSNVFYTLAAAAVVVAALYFARAILIPVAMAVLLSFLLVPLVRRIERTGLPRVPAVLTVAALVFIILGIIGFAVAQQVVNLATELPSYKSNIQARIWVIRDRSPGALDQAAQMIRELSEEAVREKADEPDEKQVLEEADGAGSAPAASGAEAGRPRTQPPRADDAEAAREADTAPEPKPVPVEVRGPPPSAMDLVETYVSPFLNPLMTAGIVIIFVLFFLIYRDDLRDRVVRLLGHGRSRVTQDALRDTHERISRYLLMQLIINLSYGVPVGLALWLIGLPGAMLWGLMATVLRFIPYVGPWMAASMPIVLSLGVFEGWTQPLLVVALFVTMELFSNNVMEPLLYGNSTGLSPLAVIVAMVFWGWLWGGIGLLLAVPLTVCLVVGGKYLYQLEIFTVLMANRANVAPFVRFYRHLVKMDEQEALQIAREYAELTSPVRTYDELLVPALHMAERERREGWLDTARQQFVMRTLRRVIRDAEKWPRPESAGEFEEDEHKLQEQEERAAHQAKLTARCRTIISIPADDAADELSAAMFAQALRWHGWDADASSVKQDAAEAVAGLEGCPQPIACLSLLPEDSPTTMTRLCLRLKQQAPNLTLIVGLWHANSNLRSLRRRLRQAGAHSIVTSFQQALDALDRLEPVPGREPEREPEQEKPGDVTGSAEVAGAG